MNPGTAIVEYANHIKVEKEINGKPLLSEYAGIQLTSFLSTLHTGKI